MRPLNNSKFVTPADPGSSPGQAPGSSNFKNFWVPDRACPGPDPGSGMTEEAVFQRNIDCNIQKYNDIRILFSLASNIRFVSVTPFL
jgi:hypothetical protein